MDSYNANQSYIIPIGLVKNTSHEPNGTPISCTMMVSLILQDMQGNSLVPINTQTYNFGPGEERSMNKGNPINFITTFPNISGNARLNAVLSDSANREIARDVKDIIIAKVSSKESDLTITSIPSGAKIYINNELTSYVTPSTIKFNMTSTVTYGIKVIMEGYSQSSESINLSPGESRVLNFTLYKYPTLNIKSTPSGAWIDIKPKNSNNWIIKIGMTDISLSLDPNEYDIRLMKDNYNDYVTSVVLNENDTKNIEINLIPKNSVYGWTLDLNVPGSYQYEFGANPPPPYWGEYLNTQTLCHLNNINIDANRPYRFFVVVQIFTTINPYTGPENIKLRTSVSGAMVDVYIPHGTTQLLIGSKMSILTGIAVGNSEIVVIPYPDRYTYIDLETAVNGFKFPWKVIGNVIISINGEYMFYRYDPQLNQWQYSVDLVNFYPYAGVPLGIDFNPSYEIIYK